jgi:hypothetical protein
MHPWICLNCSRLSAWTSISASTNDFEPYQENPYPKRIKGL